MRIEKLEVPSERRQDPLYAAHHAQGRFFNPWEPFPHRLRDLLRFWIRRTPSVAFRPRRPAGQLPRPGPSDCAITAVGHCTFVIQHGGETLLTDPHWGPRAKTQHRKTPPGLALEAVPRDAIALVSHAHYDHLDRYTVSRLPRSIRWVVPLGLARWFHRAGHRNVVELDWWQRVCVDRWTLTCLPAQHWSFRMGQRRNRSLWCSWLIEAVPRRFYFSGDSGYFDGFREFGRRFGPIDAAFLPIGTYAPRSHLRYQHMSPAESWRALDDLQAQTIIPMHWGAFQLGWDFTFDAPSALRSVVEREGGDPARTRLLDVGETWLSVGT